MSNDTGFFSSNRFSLSIVCLTFILAACGGGGGGGVGDSSTPTTTTTGTAQGLWGGTITDSAGAAFASPPNRTFAGIVLDDGSYYLLYSANGNPNSIKPLTAGMVYGTGTSTNGSFSSTDAINFNFDNLGGASSPGMAPTMISAIYSDKNTFGGTISSNVLGDMTFASAYSTDYETTPSLANLAGRYDGIASVVSYPNTAFSITVSDTGDITGGGSGCSITGSASPRTDANAYDTTITFGASPCPYQNQSFHGIIYLDSATATFYLAVTTQITPAALTPVANAAALFVGTHVTILNEVSALFPGAGENWNDYVQGSNWKTTNGAQCAGIPGNACMHGGERRKLEVPGKTDCTGLTAADDLGAFNWVCDDRTNPVQMVSTGLADGKNLSDLIDFNAPGFQLNKLNVYANGVLWGVTPSTNWWPDNPVEINNTGGSLSATDSRIYLVTENTTGNYTLSQDKIALVIRPGYALTGSGINAAISSANHNYLWLEGSINGSNYVGVNLTSVNFSMLRNLTVSNGNQFGGVMLSSASNNTLAGVTANSNSFGIMLAVSNFNTLKDVTANNNNTGVHLNDSSNNTFSGIKASNNSSGVNMIGNSITSSNNTFYGLTANNNLSYGIYVVNSNNNRFSGVTASNNNAGGIYFHNTSSNNMLLAVTAAGNGGTTGGISFASSSGNTLSGVTTASNSNSGFYLSSTSYNTFADVAAAGNSGYGFYLNGASNGAFSGSLKVGNNSTRDCYVNASTSPGLVFDTCENSPPSDAVLTRGISLAASFSADWSLYNTDTFIRGVREKPYNEFDMRIHIWSSPATDPGCGQLVAGSQWIGGACQTRYLRNAVEIQGDGIGNDNALCEPSETCLYTPNIASYQGEGELINAGYLLPVDITLKQYANNGVASP